MFTMRMLVVDGLFAGSIPASLGQLTSLETLDLTFNKLTGETQPQNMFSSVKLVSHIYHA